MSDFKPCEGQHENINRLVNVEPVPISKLPTLCVCGRPMTYAPMVVFWIFGPGIKGVARRTIELAGFAGERSLSEVELRPFAELYKEAYLELVKKNL